MKQNDWTGKLRSRLGERQESVPDDLWDRIESRLDGMQLSVRQDGDMEQREAVRRHTTTVRLALWIASTAAAIILVAIVGRRANNDTINRMASAGVDRRSAVNDAVMAEPRSAVSAKPELFAVADAHPVVHSSADGESMQETAALLSLDGSAAVAGLNGSDGVSVESRSEESASGAASQPERVSAIRHNDRNSSNVSLPLYQGNLYGSRHSSEESTRWSIEAHTGGGLATSAATDRPMATKVASYFAAGVAGDNGESSVSSISSYPLLLAKYSKTHHHAQPVSVGLSVGYALTDRIALTTGLVYTRATSDFTQSSGSDEIVDKQRLHYIGVPVGVKYNVLEIASFRAYATAGGRADFNVSATMQSGDVKTDIAKDRPQFSLSAGVGMQYNVVPQVGVFVEPGMRYYIDNHSQVETIFKEKKLNFNLQMGLRLDL